MDKTMAEVLAEHAFHMITPVDLDDVNGPWQVECNCTADPIQGPSFLAAEAEFAAHQAAALTAAGYGLVADAKRRLELAAALAYDAVEEGALREAGAKALEDTADDVDGPLIELRRVQGKSFDWLCGLADAEGRLRARAAEMRQG